MSLIVYKQDNFEEALKAINLSPTGKIYKTKGYKSPKAKLERESFIKVICVFSYTAQKQVIVYQ